MTALQGADLYRQVRARRGGRCECTYGQPGACPNDKHPSGGERCLSGDDHRGPLAVVPLDPDVPLHVAVTLPARQLIALCQSCAARRSRAARDAREQRAAADLHRAQAALF